MNSATLAALLLVVAVFTAEAAMSKDDRAKCMSQVKDKIASESDAALKGKVETAIAKITELHQTVEGLTDAEKTNLMSNYFTGVCAPIGAFFEAN